MHVTPTSDPSEPQLRETVSGDAAHDPLLTNRQAAAEIGVSVPTFYVMLKERQLPAAIYVRSNAPRWRRSELRTAVADLPRGYPDEMKGSARRRDVLRRKQKET